MISVNKHSVELAKQLIHREQQYKVRSYKEEGVTVIDCGVKMEGSWEAGKIISEILLGGLNHIYYETFPEKIGGTYFQGINVMSDFTVVQQAGCNISGWELEKGEFAPVVAGPARTLARKENDWLEPYSDYRDQYESGVITLEQSELPSKELVLKIVKAVGIPAENLYIAVASSASLVASIQVAARILEMALNRLKDLKFDLSAIKEAHGFCVVPPVIQDQTAAMGRLNDVLRYGGAATYTVDCEDSEVLDVLEYIYSETCSDYGVLFQDIYKKYGCNFYKIPSEVMAPAKIVMINQRTGNIFAGGDFQLTLLRESFGIQG